MRLGKSSAKIGALLCSLTLSACTGYSFNINENEVYSPPPLFNDYQIADSALRDCVQQTIKDQKVVKVEQLRLLNCSSAGIEDLAGLGRFSYLTRLNLANNELEQAGELTRLTRLEELVLRNNRLQSVEPLLKLIRLVKLDLRDNPDLACTDLRQMANSLEGEILIPEQCD